MNNILIIIAVVIGVLVLTELVFKKQLINISDKIVDIIYALRNRLK